MGVVVAAVLAIAAAVVLGLVLVPWLVHQRAQPDLATVAAAAGLEHSAVDPFGCTRLAFPLFRRGDGRGAEDVVWRDRGPLTTRAFRYWYYEETKDQNGQVHRSYRHFHCALALVDGSWPEVSITRDGLLEKALDVVGLGSIELESDEFNRRFALRSADRRFAITLCDPRMIEFLMSTEARFAFATKGRWVLVVSPPLDTTLVPGLLRLAEAFVDHVPRVVYELWPSPFRDEEGRPLPAGDEGFGYRVVDAEDVGERTWDVLRRSPFDALGDPDAPEYDLDGNVVEPRPEDPWGTGGRT